LLSGYGSVIPKFGEYVTAKTGVNSTQANPWQKVRVGQGDQQQLAAISTEFAVAVGLAQRRNKA
jgi:Tfp pilus assembly PilM family ATPase